MLTAPPSVLNPNPTRRNDGQKNKSLRDGPEIDEGGGVGVAGVPTFKALEWPNHFGHVGL